jgi:hypothetical protein
MRWGINEINELIEMIKNIEMWDSIDVLNLTIKALEDFKKERIFIKEIIENDRMEPTECE